MGTKKHDGPTEFSAKVVAQIKAEMAAGGILLQDLPERTGLSASSLSRYMNGHRDMNLGDVQVIANALGIDYFELMRRAGERAR